MGDQFEFGNDLCIEVCRIITTPDEVCFWEEKGLENNSPEAFDHMAEIKMAVAQNGGSLYVPFIVFFLVRGRAAK